MSANMDIQSLLPVHLLALVVVSAFAYVIGDVIYQLRFSPLSKFPGPKIAAVTYLYEFYYDAVLKGRYIFKVKELHERYGPIIRISPRELHISDPHFYSVLYSHSNPRDKEYYYLKPFDFPLSSFGTESHQLHRLRRGAMNPFFARCRVLQQESLIQDLVKKLCSRIESFGADGGVVPLSLGYTCLTTDLITTFTMDRCYGYLEAPDWYPSWGQVLRDASEMSMVSRQLTWILSLLKMLPKSLTMSLNPGLKLFYTLAERCKERIDEVQYERQKGNKGAGETVGHKKTIFDQIFDSRLSSEEKRPARLAQEVRSIIGAGTETTSNCLSVISYYLLRDPEKLRRLREELREAEPDPTAEIKLCQLERLPYLSSVVLEGLRLSYGVSTRLQRKSPKDVIEYGGYAIPPGTPVGMSSVIMHHSEDIFPESCSFVPERWLDLQERKYLEKYMVSFSSGSRRCLGMNLAKAEIFITASTIFRRFDFEMCNTTLEDIQIHHDLFIPRPKNLKTIGVQARLKGKLAANKASEE
ncbi:benzoate 4-monooxygenase cytochrome P450 [Nannizzia gypsea CBS 118893]|uniref:Benzoate 4-monooxygenase cytochrome P450 n=1 Tax=Arthroderma gypseum (strain ATCC MYA-4604 / CBS 118893) TaxID=535722 RepID=E4UZK1_ARTGP|nr:benzoate 4-monooxygenase cytochrome P450 [Nannizzia gypsea CBS 118893]EFR03531.1 benzoate 4-monooxygenase cytochrome P450 [Nannizzia gypsea CBS 118893]